MSNPASRSIPPPPFLQREAVRQLPELREALERVVRSGRFLFGEELGRFERELADSVGCAEGVGVGTGTDAIQIALRALDVGPGDEVITQTHSSPFTAIAIHEVGARPVFVESTEDDFGIDPEAVRRALSAHTRAILVVHLYGHPARIEEVVALAADAGVHVLEDCAQAQGATIGGKPVGSFGVAGCFSFYPTKNLGALGDSGAITTDDVGLAVRMRRLRNGGLVSHGIHAERGVTSRMDEVQAAFLRFRLRELEAANDARRAHARAYDRGLRGVVRPAVRDGVRWAPHQYVVRHPRREELRAAAAARGIGLLVHYPLPIHLQSGFESPAATRGSLPVAERLAAEVVSLPTHPDMLDDERERIVAVINEWAASV